MKKWIKTIIMISVILLLGLLSTINSTMALVSLLVLIIGYPLIRLWKERELFVGMMKQTEVVIFKKPLDKNFWDKGELKNTKVKVTWKGLFKKKKKHEVK